jgi:hypothetical protein
MMLRDVIKTIPDWEKMTAEQVFSALTTPVIEIRDDQQYTWAGVAILAGPEAAEGLRMALEQNGMGWAVHQLGGSGLQLSHPLTQQVLTAFEKAIPALTILKNKGIHYISLGERYELSFVLDDVEASLDAIKFEESKQVLMRDAANRYNAFIDAIDDWDGSGNPPVL